MRIEHVQQSRCREDFLKRVKENEEKKRLAKEKKEPVIKQIVALCGLCNCIELLQIPKGALKRQPKSAPLRGHFVILPEGVKPTLVEPIAYQYIG